MKNKSSISSFLSEYVVLLGIIVAFFVGMSIASPYFLTFSNITNIIQYVSTYGIVSIGMLLVILTGGINLSVGGTLAISAYIGCSLMLKGYPWFVSVLVCVLVGMFVGLINGLAVTKLNIPPLIATLAVEQMARGMHLGLAQGAPLTGFSQTYLNIGASKLLNLPMSVWWTILLYIIFFVILHKTCFGRTVYAVGGNPMAARVAGVNNDKMIISVYMLAGFLCAAAGIIVTGRMNSVAVSIAQGLDTRCITCCVLGGASVTRGGKGTIIGCFLGVFIIGLLQNSLDLLAVSSYWQTFIQGVVLFLAVSAGFFRTFFAERRTKVR
ncbi:MAG: ABC transporter permease [Lachnospiraceae bacterium]|jgi:ribose transport system permease protein|nr:ABC transporter permease [Lachnospiraceae bacterium]RKJ48700.1 ABC transporter permease [bacterium 1XD42-54]